MQAAGGRQAFDGGHLAALALRCERQARQHALAVEQHRAGAARALVAAVLRAGQVELVAQCIEERDAAVETPPPGAPVDPQHHVDAGGHRVLSAVVPRPAKTTWAAAANRATNASRDSPRALDRYFAPWAIVCSASAISSGVTISRLRSCSDIAAAIAAAIRASNSALAGSTMSPSCMVGLWRRFPISGASNDPT